MRSSAAASVALEPAGSTRRRSRADGRDGPWLRGVLGGEPTQVAIVGAVGRRVERYAWRAGSVARRTQR